MKITEYWARLVAAGLAPDWPTVWAVKTTNDHYWRLCDSLDSLCQEIGVDWMYADMETMKREKDHRIQLRKDGIDLIGLKWRKPTEQDIGKMCWFWNIEDEILTFGKKGIQWNDEYLYLLADHGQICPDELDFLKVYGG